MTTYNMNPYAGFVTVPTTSPPSGDLGYGGRLITRTATITYASQASGSTLNAVEFKKGELFLGGFLVTDTSTGSTTLSVGVSGDTARFKALAAITTVNLPTWFFSNPSAGTPYQIDPAVANTADQLFLITTAAATAPSSGTLAAVFLFSKV